MQAAKTIPDIRAISYSPIMAKEFPVKHPAKAPRPKATRPGQYPFDESQIKNQTSSQKLDTILKLIECCGWSLGEFLHQLFRPNDSWTTTQSARVASFLCGTSKIKPLDIVKLWYGNRQGRPSSGDPESKDYFSVSKRSSELRYARTALSTWALEIVGKRMTREADRAVQDPGLRLRASEKDSTFENGKDLIDVGVLVENVDDVISHVARAFGGSQGEDYLDWTDEDMEDSINERTLCEDFDDFENEDLETQDIMGKPISRGGGVFADSRDNNAVMMQNFTVPGSSCRDASFFPGATMNLIGAKRPAASSKTLVSWSAMADFSIPSLKKKYRMMAPTTWHLLEILATKESQLGSSDKIAGCLPGEKVRISLQILVNCRTDLYHQ